MSDIDVLTQLVLKERQGRDRGWWQQMRDVYWPDGRIQLSWFTGAAHDFVDASERMSGRGDTSTHRLSPPVVHVVGDRALIQVSAAIEVSIEVDGASGVLVSYARIEYRAERRDGEWKLSALETIYERDALMAKVPGQSLKIDAETLAKHRPSYALLSSLLESRGYPVTDDLLGDDRPEQIEEFYRREFDWLHDQRPLRSMAERKQRLRLV